MSTPADQIPDEQDPSNPNYEPLTEELEQIPDQQNPPTENGPSPDYVRALEEQLKIQHRQISDLTEAVRAPAPVVQREEVEDPDVARNRYYNDPQGETRKLIRAELEATIAPLTNQVRELLGGSELTRVKTALRSNPIYAKLAEQLNDPQIDQAVDQILAKADKNEATLSQAIIHAVGLKSVGALDAHIPPTTHTTQPEPKVEIPVPNPPHMRPSNPVPPRTTTQKREPTELERRIMRENGFASVEEYDRWMNLNPQDVVRVGRDGKPVTVAT